MFWFSSGSFIGRAAVRDAFEGTRGRLRDEHYWLGDLRWLARGEQTASCIYRFSWRAMVDGVPASGHSQRTTVLAAVPGGWRIVH